MRRTSITLGTMLALCGAFAGTASAATRAVDDDAKATPSNCNATTPASPSIQAAVTASSAGDTIVVCPGTYVEQVNVPAGKNNLTLYSSERRQAIIKAPALSSGTYNRSRPDLVRVEGAKNVTFARFTITGPLPDDQFCNDLLVTTVRVLGGGSANLVDNRITKAKPSNPALLGCQNGFGVGVGRTAENETGSAKLFGNEIDDYDKGGIYADNVGSSLYGTANVVRGPDLSGFTPAVALAAPNGVQISRGADADFDYNAVLDNTFPGFTGVDAGQASGIILFDNDQPGHRGDVRMSDNLVRNNDNNLGLFNQDGSRFDDNSLLDAPFYEGIYADPDSKGNVFSDNTALNNKELDCQDQSTGTGTAGTANVWKNNRGRTSSPPGICRDKRGGGNGRGDDDRGRGDD